MAARRGSSSPEPQNAVQSSQYSGIQGYNMSSFLRFLGRTTAQLFLPYQSLFEPINTILNAPQDRKKELVVKWKDTTLYELNFIGIVAALLASVVTSSLAWPVASPLPWSVRSLWLTALLFALISLSLACQQAIALTRVSNSEFAVEKIRHLLGEPCEDENRGPGQPKEPVARVTLEGGDPRKWRPLKLQLYVWQIPSMLLGNAVLIFVIGLAVWVYATARDAGHWGDERKIAIFFGCFMAFVTANYVLNWTCIERRVQMGIERP